MDVIREEEERSMAISWSDLHPDLLAEIFKRLYPVDYIRCLSVCSWWRSVPEKTMNFCLPKKDDQIPWLLITTPDDKPDSRCFYDLTCLHNKYIMNLPQIAGRHCIGSTQGFLITVDSSAKFCALNPLTRTSFPLPPTATHPAIRIYDEHLHDAPPRIIIPDDVTPFYQKAVISPTLDTIAVVVDGLVTSAKEPVLGRPQFFCNVLFARAGDDTWTALMSPFIWEYMNSADIYYAIADLIFHKGHLYVLHRNGYLFVFNHENLAALPLVSPPGQTGIGGMCGMYMTETPDKEDILLLWRYSRMEAIFIFKLDKNTLEWISVQSIGDIALFLGGSYLTSSSTREFPCLKRNCVYFTFVCPSDNSNHTGVYDLEDGSIHPLSLGDDLEQLNWQPSIWFTPTF